MDAIGRTTHEVLGFRDFVLIPQRKLVFSVSCGLKAGALMPKKSYKLSDGSKIEVGAVECWLQSNSDLDKHRYEKLWHKNLSGKGVTLAWDDTNGYIGIGMDNGLVAILKINPKSPAKYKEYVISKPHKSKVSGLFFDESTNRLFTIGEDKNFHSYDIKSKTIHNSKLRIC